MTFASIKRRFPHLIRQVEREEGKRFLKKPTLHFHNGRPYSDGIRYRKGRKVTHIEKARVFLNRRMCRDREDLAILTAKHELREVLFFQHGYSKTKANRYAREAEHRDRKKLGLKKSYGWLAREFWKPKSQSSMGHLSSLLRR